ncbi:GNAT family N-acetyltransferase [Antarctobacter heliothermus]|uniref:Acetyltransferase (GNAT) family protein n=1 Tax=Antarctobacter heliothermus TaxID=74033 RepID=A0A239I3D9_9RHOB|nr:GNAT family N-acetyltransferase [Antarctobacter heliothermus]SNS88001.1 Acetyltransferase (GNAT) family protein [Antarctobacter heliothermus]
MSDDLNPFFDALDATWPAAARVAAGPWVLREGRGGGKRVSAATARGDWREDDLAAAEKSMKMMGQVPLFMIRPGEEALDAALSERGYALIDPVQLWVAPIDRLTDLRLPRVTAFAIWEPLAIMREIWEAGGIGAARQRIMDRAAPPKTGILGRVSDKPAGAGFCAVHGETAMVHALEIAHDHRQKGLGGWMMRCAALWAADQGASRIAVAATRENTGANALYATLKMEVAGHYHYRILNAESEDL